MALYSLSEQAKIGLQEIWGYIAQDNPIAADKVEGKLLQAFALLAERPFIGQRREDMTSLEVRFWPVFKLSDSVSCRGASLADYPYFKRLSGYWWNP